jgi:HEAT repeat protein
VRRARAADLLGRASVPRAVPELIRLLEDRDGDVRQTAARALGLIGNPAAVPALLETIEPRTVPLNTSTMAILRMDRGARAPLIDGLLSESQLVRAICAELLGRLGAVSALPELTNVVLSDPALEVRIRAARALGMIGAPSAVDALAAAMRSHEPAPLRAVATRALGRIGGRRTIALLRGALGAPEHVVAMNAAQALAAIGDEGEEVLAQVLLEGPTSRADYAREGLSQVELSRSRRVRA